MIERSVPDRRDYCPRVWDVMRGRRYIGTIIRWGRRGKLQAFVSGSVHHYDAPVGNVAAGVRWIARRAPR